jgi:hypothetical protein
MAPSLEASEAGLLVARQPLFLFRRGRQARRSPLASFRKAGTARGSPRDAPVVTRAKASEWEDKNGDVVQEVAQDGAVVSYSWVTARLTIRSVRQTQGDSRSWSCPFVGLVSRPFIAATRS